MGDEVTVVGVDGFRGGWVAVTASGDFEGCRLFRSFGAVASHHADASVIAVDMPIGLGSREPRTADIHAREFLGRRRNSVFVTPPREALDARNYEDAAAVSRRLGGRGLSRQAYALLSKVREVELVAGVDRRIFEVHPEVSFTALNGAPLEWTKKTWSGAAARRRLLSREGIQLPDELGDAGRAPVDDVLDAAAAAWSARRIASGRARSLPDPPESIRGRRVAIWY